MSLYTSSRRGTCRTCRHNQAMPIPQGYVDVPPFYAPANFGTCRALPPLGCLAIQSGWVSAEPIFPLTADLESIVGAILGKNGCGGWEQKNSEEVERVVTSPELVIDGDFEIALLPAWLVYNCVKTRETAFPRSGNCARVAYTPSSAIGYISQGAFVYFPYRFSSLRISGFARGDGSAIPEVKIVTPGPYSSTVTVWTGTSSTAWQAFDIPIPCDPNGQAYVYYLDIQLIGTNLDVGRYVEFDAVSIVQYQQTNKKIKCWTCRHFQAYSSTRMGECRRALPEPLCIDTTLTDDPAHRQEPLFPKIIDSDVTWCSGWQQCKNPTAPLPAIIWVPGVIPPIYNYPGNPI